MLSRKGINKFGYICDLKSFEATKSYHRIEQNFRRFLNPNAILLKFFSLKTLPNTQNLRHEDFEEAEIWGIKLVLYFSEFWIKEVKFRVNELDCSDNGA